MKSPGSNHDDLEGRLSHVTGWRMLLGNYAMLTKREPGPSQMAQNIPADCKERQATPGSSGTPRYQVSCHVLRCPGVGWQCVSRVLSSWNLTLGKKPAAALQKSHFSSSLWLGESLVQFHCSQAALTRTHQAPITLQGTPMGNAQGQHQLVYCSFATHQALHQGPGNRRQKHRLRVFL